MDYNEMTDKELAAEKLKLERQRDSLKAELREIVAIQDLRVVKAEFDAMPDSKKESLRQIIGK